MSNLKNQLFWEKYRPKTLNNMVILPRIRKYLEKGILDNLILHGHSGTGKSTITNILLKNKNYLNINASMENGIDTLREKIMDFCDSMPSPFIKTDDKMKYVYLEEFEKTTENFQDGFKAFIEKYDDRVRFVINMNDISEIKIPALNSRFTKICFNPSNDVEKEFLMNGYHKYLMSVAKHSKTDISDEKINRIISANFPDLRASVQEIQTIFITGDQETPMNGNNQAVFEYVLNRENDFSKNFYFVMDNWVNRPKELLNILGRPFYTHLLQNNKEIINLHGFELLKLNKQYNAEFEMTTDPPLHVFSLICEIKKLMLDSYFNI
jgi:replication-associated recombination protein RarA